MSEQEPKSRPVVVISPRAGTRPATARDALNAFNQLGRQTHEQAQAALMPIREQAREAHATLLGIAESTSELLGAGRIAGSGGAAAIADPPAPDLGGEERAQIEAAWEAADSENTRRAYRSQWRRFAKYCMSRREQALPAHPAMVAAYLTGRIEDGVGIASLRQAAAAIRRVHLRQRLGDPCADEVVKQVLAGLARKHGAPAGQARGLTLEDFERIRTYAHRPRRGKRGRLEKEAAAQRRGDFDVALIGSMRDGLLRRSEAAAICWGDLSYAEDGSGRLLLRHSKTDKEGRGHIAYVADVTMADLELIRPPRPRPEERVFGLSTSQISRRIAASARAAGLGGGYSGHSPRVGMTVDLVAAGFSLAELQQAGRWRSPVMPAYYARNQLSGRGAVAQFHQTRSVKAKTEAESDGLVRPDFGAGAGRPFDEPSPDDFPAFGP